MDKQDSREKELLEQIKFCLLCKNEAQAIRLIEKYKTNIKDIFYCHDELISRATECLDDFIPCKKQCIICEQELLK